MNKFRNSETITGTARKSPKIKIQCNYMTDLQTFCNETSLKKANGIATNRKTPQVLEIFGAIQQDAPPRPVPSLHERIQIMIERSLGCRD